MQKQLQSKIAFLSVLLFSRTVFAAGSRPVEFLDFNSVHPLENEETNFGTTEDVGAGKVFTFPGFSEIDFLTTGALETHPFEGESEITGDFGLPETELLNGNIEQAKLSCIKQALDGGEHILNASDSSAWEFATKDSANPITGNLPTKSPNLISKHLSNVNAPAAFANGSACTQSLEKTA